METAFIIDILGTPAKSYVAFFELKFKHKILSIKELFLLSILEERCVDAFDLFFNNSIYQNQRLHMKMVVDFDYDLQKTEKIVREGLARLHDFYIFLSNDHINLADLEKNCQELLD